MEEKIIPVSEWVLRKEEVKEAKEVAYPLITPEEREELKKIVEKSYKIAKKTGERILDVLKRMIEKWKEEKEKKKLKEALPEKTEVKSEV